MAALQLGKRASVGRLPGARSQHGAPVARRVPTCLLRVAHAAPAAAAQQRDAVVDDGPTTSGQTRETHGAAAAHSRASQDEQEGYATCFWDWEYDSQVCYYHAGSSGVPLLLVHGFGVGGYHFDRNIPQLSQRFRVWAVDLLGQGRSWPAHPVRSDKRLYYSVDMWTRQLASFIEHHVPKGERVYVAGNSLGGYLAVSLASQRPDLVKGLVLLNATPFWAFRPAPQPGGGAVGPLWALLDRTVDGSVPVPEGLKRVIETYWWNKLRAPETVRSLIQLVYAHKAAADEPLIQRIVEATEQPGALDAFASIALSPKTALDFDAMLATLTCSVCMIYGRDDPWVVPLWGQRLKRQVPSATYLELTPAGHCPHHESPSAVNRAIGEWLSHQEDGCQRPFPLGLEEEWQVQEADGREISIRHVEGRPRNFFEHIDYFTWQLARAVAGVIQAPTGTQQ